MDKCYVNFTKTLTTRSNNRWRRHVVVQTAIRKYSHDTLEPAEASNMTSVVSFVEDMMSFYSFFSVTWPVNYDWYRSHSSYRLNGIIETITDFISTKFVSKEAHRQPRFLSLSPILAKNVKTSLTPFPYPQTFQ